MKTVIVLSALAAIAFAGPVWENGSKQDPQHSTIHKTIRRERKSTIQETPADLSIDHDTSLTGAKDLHLNARSNGFRKPVIVKKKFGYQIFRDSDEELAQAQPRENCRRQFRFKLCDESDETAVNNMRTINTEDTDERDVQHSLKMAKEAVEILQRDLQKIEESTKTMHKNHLKENVENNIHKNIEQAKEASQQLTSNIGNLDALALKTLSSKEANVEQTDSKLEESRITQWKEAIENIQKNVEIVKNLEDTFKSAELSHVISGEDFTEMKTKHTENWDTIHAHILDNNEKTRTNENEQGKLEENIHNKNVEAKSDILSYATETKETNTGLHSDSLKLDNARSWDISENVRHAETGAWQEKSNQESKNEMVQQETGDVVEKKSVLHTDADDLQVKKESKKTDIMEEVEKNTHSKIQHEKAVEIENKENLSERSNDLREVKEDINQNTADKTLKSVEDISSLGKSSESVIATTDNKQIETGHLNLEKDAEVSETKNVIHTENTITSKQALNQDLVDVEPKNEKMKSILEPNLMLNAELPMARSSDDVSEAVTSFKNAELLDTSHLQMREALDQTSDDKQVIEKSAIENKELEMRHTEEDSKNVKESEHSRIASNIEDKNLQMHKTNFEKTVDESAHQEHVESKKSADKEINHSGVAFQKSDGSKNTEEKMNHIAKDNAALQKHNEQLLDQANSMRFVDVYGDSNRNLAINSPDLGNDYQQRMSELDFFNNMNSQHASQLEADKNIDFHTSSHINQAMSDWDRNQQHLHHSMLRPPFMPWMQDRFRTNIDFQLGNQHELGKLQLDNHPHEHLFNHIHLDGHHHHHHHALPMGRFVNNIQTGIKPELLNGPMMRENALENGGAIELDNAMQPSMKINMRDALDQNGMKWNYQATGKSGFGGNIGSGTVGVFPTANSGCGIPLLLSCSPSVVSGSLAKQALGYPGHALRSDDMRFYTKRDAQGINDIKGNIQNLSTTS